MPGDQQIDDIELPAADLDAIGAFYTASFGWTFTDYGPEYCAFADGRFHFLDPHGNELAVWSEQ